MSDAEGATEYIIELLKEIKQLREENERMRGLVKYIYKALAGLQAKEDYINDFLNNL